MSTLLDPESIDFDQLSDIRLRCYIEGCVNIEAYEPLIKNLYYYACMLIDYRAVFGEGELVPDCIALGYNNARAFLLKLAKNIHYGSIIVISHNLKTDIRECFVALTPVIGTVQL